ncbi:MAG: hypothetical protein WCG97_00355 [bacterium]
MFEIQKIQPEESHAVIDSFLKSRKFVPIFFYSPYTINTWLNHQNKSLYVATLDHERVFMIHKEVTNEVRFLFSEPSDQMCTEIKAHFKPQFISANELGEASHPVELYTSYNELMIDVTKVANLEDPEVSKDYKKCQLRHPDLKVVKYTVNEMESIKTFLNEWSHTRSAEMNKRAKIENDLRFFSLYMNALELKGLLIKDADKVIAISFFIPSLDGKVIGVINKCLRGYTQLGVYTFVERAKMMLSLGYTEAYIGAINNDFKKRFINSAVIHKTLAREIFRSPEFVTSGPYILRLF